MNIKAIYDAMVHPPGNSPSRANSLVHAAIITLLGVVIYSNSMHVPFIFDDYVFIYDNPAFKDFRTFLSGDLAEKLMGQGVLEQNFRTRSVAFFTFAINYQLHGHNVFGYHLANLLIHVVNGVLVYWLVLLTMRTPFALLKIGRNAPPAAARLTALLAALLFVSHPIQTEAVTYLTQRFASLSALFYLLSLALYVHGRLATLSSGATKETKNRPVSRWRPLAFYGLAVVSAVLAMNTKETSFTLPVAILLYEALFFSGEWRKRLLCMAPIGVTMLIIPLKVVGKYVNHVDVITLSKSSTGDGQSLGFIYLCNQFRSLVTYLRLLVLPVGQNLEYDYPVAASFFEPPVLLSFIFLAALAGAAVYLYRRSGRPEEKSGLWLRLIAFGIFWFFLTLAIESSIFPLGELILEHRMYLPSLGPFLALVAAAAIMRERLGAGRAKWVTVALAALIVVWSSATFARNAVWQDPIVFWEDVIQKSPNKARPHSILANLYKSAGLSQEAFRELEIALKLNPKLVGSEAYCDLASLYIDQGNYDAAVQMIEKSKTVENQSPRFYNDIGTLWASMNRFTEAEAEYRHAIAINMYPADAYRNLGDLYAKQKRFDEALASFTEAAKLEPANSDIQYNIGITLALKGNFAEAAKALQEALRLNPTDDLARQALDQVMTMLKQ